MRYFRYVRVLATALLAVPLVIAAPQPVASAAADDNPNALLRDGLSAYETRNYDLAIELLTRAIKGRPDFSDAYYVRALAYEGKGELASALSDLTATIKGEPYFAGAYGTRGRVEAQLKQYDLAIQDYTAFFDHHGDDTEVSNGRAPTSSIYSLCGRANIYYSRGQYDLAIADYKRLIATSAASKVEIDAPTRDIVTAANLDIGLAYSAKQDWPNAIVNYTAYLKLKPNDADGLLNRGDAYQWNKQYILAAVDYRAYLTARPSDPEGYGTRGLAIALTSVGDYEEAIATCKTYLAVKPDDKAAWNNLAVANLKGNHYAEGIDAYTHLIQLDPSNIDAYRLRAAAYVHLKQYVQAIADCDKVMSVKPDALTYYNRGVSYEGMIAPVWDKAVADFTASLAAKSTGNVNAYLGRATAYAWLKQYDKAVADYTAYLKENPDDIKVRYRRAIAYYHAGNLKAALPDLQAYLDKNPSDRQAINWVTTTRMQMSTGSHGDVIGAAQKALAADPTNATLAFNLGVALSGDKQYDAAAAAFEKAASIAPDAETYNNEGNALYQAGKQDEAITAYTRAIAKDPTYANAYLNRGDVYARQKKYTEAVADYSNYLKYGKNLTAEQTTRIYRTRATAYVNLKNYPSALQDYNKVLAATPNDADPLYGRALAEYGTGDYDHAIADLRAAITTGKAGANTTLFLGTLLVEMRDFSGAVAAYTSFILNAPRSHKDLVEAYVGRGLAYAASDDADKAVADYDQATTLAPTDPRPFYNKGIALEQKAKKEEDAWNGEAATRTTFLNDYKLAVAAFQKFVQVAPPTDAQVTRVKAHLDDLQAHITSAEKGR